MEIITVRDIQFRLGRRGILLPDDLPEEVWAELYESAWAANDASAWTLADLIAYGFQHYGTNAYNAIGDATQLSRGRLYNMKSVAEAVPRENRVYDVSFSHYTEVAKLEPEDQRRWLEWSVETEASRDDLRYALSGGHEQQLYLPPVRPSTPMSALYWLRDALTGKRSMTRKEMIDVINEVIRRYKETEDEESDSG